MSGEETDQNMPKPSTPNSFVPNASFVAFLIDYSIREHRRTGIRESFGRDDRAKLRDLFLKQLLEDLKGHCSNYLYLHTRRGRSREGFAAAMMRATQTRSFGIQCDSKRSTGVQTKRLSKDGRFHCRYPFIVRLLPMV